MKRAIIVHGWDGYPEEGWFPRLKKELEAEGSSVFVPQLPKPDEPRINNWVPKLKEIVGNPDEQTYFVGHSMGCQTIARFLETLPKNIKVGGVVFVAGYFKRLTNLEDDEVVRSVVQEWLTTPLNLKAVKTHLKKSVAIFSDDDPWVPSENQNDFRDVLDSKIIVMHAQGHFSGSRDGCVELPVALDALLEVAGEKL